MILQHHLVACPTQPICTWIFICSQQGNLQSTASLSQNDLSSIKLSNKNIFDMTRFPIFYRLTKSSFWLFAVWVGTSIKVEIGWLGPENTKTSGEFWFQLSFSVITYFPTYSASSGSRTSEVYFAGAYHPESIDTIWDDHKMDKWTKSRAIYRI